jgi:hypothetical protein
MDLRNFANDQLDWMVLGESTVGDRELGKEPHGAIAWCSLVLIGVRKGYQEAEKAGAARSQVVHDRTIICEDDDGSSFGLLAAETVVQCIATFPPHLLFPLACPSSQHRNSPSSSFEASAFQHFTRVKWRDAR